jgi:hypothetical protein
VRAGGYSRYCIPQEGNGGLVQLLKEHGRIPRDKGVRQNKGLPYKSCNALRSPSHKPTLEAKAPSLFAGFLLHRISGARKSGRWAHVEGTCKAGWGPSLFPPRPPPPTHLGPLRH